MQNTSSITCYNCSSPLSERAKFCGYCRMQVRCKECSSELEPLNAFCIECSAEISKISKPGDTENFNTISIRETLSERHIEAKFSNEVGKDLTGILRDAMISNKNTLGAPKNNLSMVNKTEDTDYQEIDKELPTNPNSQTLNPQEKEEDNAAIPSFPDILNIAMKALPATEVEWVLVYSFYASSFGNSIFTRDDILAKYDESKRRTSDRLSNYATNIKSLVRAGKLSILTSGYSILDPGIDAAKEIISRTKAAPQSISTKKSKNKASKKSDDDSSTPKKKSSRAPGAKRLNNIDFYPTGKNSLDTFFKKYTVKNDFERILLFVYYMKDVLEIDAISYDHIYTCFDTLDLKTPLDVPQITRNSASAQGWIDLTDSKNIQVTVNGKNEIRKWNAK